MQKNIPLVDSNILIHFFIKSALFEKAKTSLKNGAYINDCVLAETLNFIQNKFSAYKSLSTAQHIFKYSTLFTCIPIEETDRRSAEQIMKMYLDNSLSYVDSLLLAQAKRFGLDLLRVLEEKNLPILPHLFLHLIFKKFITYLGKLRFF